MVSTGQFPRVQDVDSTLMPFISRKDELALQQGCLMWGIRVVIPLKLRPRVLSELHTGHPGVVKLSLAVTYGGQELMLRLSKSQRLVHLVSRHKNHLDHHHFIHGLHGSPWQRIHVDFAGPFQGHMFMLVIDAHSKLPEAHLMSSITASKTIKILRRLFSRYRLLEVLVSANGPQFTSSEFHCFMKSHGVKHTRSAPFQPSTNGLAERFVQTFKHSLNVPQEQLQFNIDWINVCLCIATLHILQPRSPHPCCSCIAGCILAWTC